jgi:hypothetical protein
VSAGIIASSYNTPDSLPGLVLWLDARRIPDSDGTNITTWSDLSGNGYDFTRVQGSATITASRTPSGHRAVVGNSNAQVSRSSYLSAQSYSAAEVFTFYKPPSSGGSWVIDAFGSAGQASHMPWSDGKVYTDFGSTVRKINAAVTGISADTWAAVSMYSASNDWRLYVDGTERFSTSTNTVGWRNGTHYVFQGVVEMAEVFMYNRVLTSSERAAMFSYLRRHA